MQIRRPGVRGMAGRPGERGLGARLAARLSGRLPAPLRPGARRARQSAAAAPTTEFARAGEPLPDLEYAPRRDGRPDPGEVVWAWVPYEEDPRRGKDRPVLIVGRANDRLVGLMLSSRDHDLDAADEARWGRYWMDIGTGGWDSRRRPSEVRLDRVLSVPPEGVRREGAALAAPTFARVAAALRALHPA